MKITQDINFSSAYCIYGEILYDTDKPDGYAGVNTYKRMVLWYSGGRTYIPSDTTYIAGVFAGTSDYYRVVDFGTTPQEVSDEFYSAFTANAREIICKKPTYKRVNGAWKKQDVYECSNGAWTRVSGRALESFNIATNLTNITADVSNPTTVELDGIVDLRFVANDGYSFPSSIGVVGIQGLGGGATMNVENNVGTLRIYRPVCDVVITMEGKAV